MVDVHKLQHKTRPCSRTASGQACRAKLGTYGYGAACGLHSIKHISLLPFRRSVTLRRTAKFVAARRWVRNQLIKQHYPQHDLTNISSVYQFKVSVLEPQDSAEYKNARD